MPFLKSKASRRPSDKGRAGSNSLALAANTGGKPGEALRQGNKLVNRDVGAVTNAQDLRKRPPQRIYRIASWSVEVA